MAEQSIEVQTSHQANPDGTASLFFWAGDGRDPAADLLLRGTFDEAAGALTVHIPGDLDWHDAGDLAQYAHDWFTVHADEDAHGH